MSREQLDHLVFPERKDPQEIQALREKGENRSINNIIVISLNSKSSLACVYSRHILFHNFNCIDF